MAGRHARPTRAAARAGEYAQSRQPLSARVRAIRRQRRWRRTRNAGAGSALLSGALIVGLLSGGGTFALWQGEQPLPDVTIHAIDEGEVSMKFAAGPPTSATATFTNLLPGESMTIPVLLENDGDYDLAVTANLTEVTGSGYSLRMEIDAACTTSGFLASPYLPGPTPVMAPYDPVAVGSIDEGQTAKLCVEVTADTDITPSSTMAFTVTITGDSGS